MAYATPIIPVRTAPIANDWLPTKPGVQMGKPESYTTDEGSKQFLDPSQRPAESYMLTVEHGAAGLWYVTGSMHRGLVVIGHTMGEALSRVEGVWADLRQADEELARAGR